MNRLILIATLMGLILPLCAQETAEKTMEKRAREMHRVISLSDKEQWKKFIQENYSQTLIDKAMRMQVEDSDGKSNSNQAATADKIEGKAAMLQQLHQDFGSSKIISIKPSTEGLEMVLKNSDGLNGVFNLKFSKDKPYLIDGLGIEVQGDGQ